MGGRWVNLDPLIAELQAARTALIDPLEGLDDVAHLDIQGDTSNAIRDAEQSYKKRDQLLAQAIKCLEELKAHGYPELPFVQDNPAVVVDIMEQSRTVAIAGGLFRPTTTANTFKVEFSSPKPK